MHSLATTLIAASGAPPAGGAAIGQVIAATGGATVGSAALAVLGLRHRAGQTTLLKRAAAFSSRFNGAPPWAALPFDVATISLLTALFGMYWDISLHIDNGRDPGPLANPAHYFILVGLFGIFAAGFFAVVLPEGRPSRSSVRIGHDWYAPVGGVLLLLSSSFALLAFPLDDVWHRLFGQDVTLWGPTHLMMIGGAGLSLLGSAALLVESHGDEAGRTGSGPRGLHRVLRRTRFAGTMGGLLIGLSTFQGEFDFGVPQFQELFHPMLIAFGAGVALVAARLYAGRGGPLMAVGYFLAIRGIVSLLVGPVLGQTTPHLPLYLGEAVVVELAGLRLAAAGPVRFGALAGLLVGTVGTATEWAWSHVWMPFPWPSSMLGAVAVVAPLAGIAGGLVGGFVGTALAAPRRRVAVPPRVPALAGLVVMAALIGVGLATHADGGLRADLALRTLRPGPQRTVAATIRLHPAGAARHARWLNVTAWQGGGLVVDRLHRIGPGVYRTTMPIPVHGKWKTLLRLHRGNAIQAVPIYLPADPAIPARGLPASAHIDRAFVPDKQILQRERRKGIPGFLALIAYLVVAAIAVSLILGLGWALARLARAAGGEEPPAPAAQRRTPARVGGPAPA